MERKIVRLDELPLVFHCLQKLNIDTILDRHLPRPHGNRQGLSQGQLGLLFLVYVIYLRSHKLCDMQEWVSSHHEVLCELTGWDLSVGDATDDRLCALMGVMGQSDEQVETIQQAVGSHMVFAFDLSQEPAVRYDLTSFTVHHSPHTQDSDGLLRHGHSKDHRPDLLQFKQGLATLSPSGVPLCAQTLAGHQADDPQYLPAWYQISRTLQRSDFLFVTDSKGAALATRYEIQRQGGYYLCPLPMTGTVPNDLKTWVLTQDSATLQTLTHTYVDGKTKTTGQGFEVSCERSFEQGGATDSWTERVLVVRSDSHAHKQLKTLEKNRQLVQHKLQTLQKKSFCDMETLENQVIGLLQKYQLQDCYDLRFFEIQETIVRYHKRGKPTAHSPKTEYGVYRPHFEFSLNEQRWRQRGTLCGWRLYAINAPQERCALQKAVSWYRDQWQVEVPNHRFKGGDLPVLPLFLKKDERIRGLLAFLFIALQALTLIEFQIRLQLSPEKTLQGLFPYQPKRKTHRPTAELIFKAFANLNLMLTRHNNQFTAVTVESLNPLQTQILKLLNCPLSLYNLQFEGNYKNKSDPQK